MPVYEFRCKVCSEITSELRKMGDFTPPACASCGSAETEKLFSLFAGGGSDCAGCTSASHKGG
jgi:putative FmdB family regulatory protein